MSPAKWISVVIIAVLFLATYLILDNSKTLYRTLPGNLDLTMPAQGQTNATLLPWKTFSSDVGHFRVDLPVEPEHATEDSLDKKSHKKRKYEMFVSQQDDGTIFMISLVKFPPDSSEPNEQTLKALVDDTVAADPKNKLESQNNGTFLNNPAKDFEIVNEQFHFRIKAFIANKTLYILTYVSPLGSYDPKAFDQFTNSFQLTP